MLLAGVLSACAAPGASAPSVRTRGVSGLSSVVLSLDKLK